MGTTGTEGHRAGCTVVTAWRAPAMVAWLVLLAAHPAGAQAAEPRLPVHEVASVVPGRRLAILLTGDGDWAALDRTIAETLAARGVSVVGLESRQWLSHGARKDPAAAAKMLAALITEYGAKWQRDSVLVIGYSRGAELAPFAVARLPEALRARVVHLTMLGPSPTANFTFHLIDLLKDTARPDDVAMLPEVERLRGLPMLCLYGREEKQSLCTILPAGLAHVVGLEGGHHFDKDFAALATRILDDLRTTR